MKKKEKEKNEKLTFKIITIGDANVGKTSIIRRYIYNAFNENTISTIGLTFAFKEIILKNGEKILLKLIDTAGQERYNSLSKSYFKNVDGVLFIFAFNKLESFQNIEKWIHLFEESNNDTNLPKYLIGNKNDLEKEVDKDLIDNFIEKYNYKFEECSALNNDNIDHIFQDIGEVLYQQYQLKEKDQKNIKITEFVEKKETKKNCICVIR